MSASKLNARYKELTGQNHPVFTEQAPKVIDDLMKDKDMLIQAGAYGTDYFDKTRYELRFRSIQKAQTQYVKMRAAQVKNKKNTSKQNLGHKQAKRTSKPKTSLLKSGYNAITRHR